VYDWVAVDVDVCVMVPVTAVAVLVVVTVRTWVKVTVPPHAFTFASSPTCPAGGSSPDG
jgi:hypothetical protein